MNSGSDQLKFHRLTKPVKFRRTKLFFKSVGHSYGVGVSKIKYLCNYILYKLNILKRYDNSTFTELWRPTVNGEQSEVVEKLIVTPHFVGVAQSQLLAEVFSWSDYFYYLDRKGHKHRTYTVMERETYFYKVVTSFIKPGLIIDGKTYVYGEVPKIVRVLKEPVGAVSMEFSEEVFKPRAVEYDLSKLMNIRYETMLGERSDDDLDLSFETVQRAIEKAQTEIKRYLENLTLHDIER